MTNILFIMDDQHRWDYINTDFVDTPNLGKLAEQGTTFTHCTCNAPLCAPSRIGLATGLLPERLGALDNQAYLPRSQPTYYQRLRDENYQVGLVGKLDLAKPDGFLGIEGARPHTFGLGFTHPHETEGKMNAGRGMEIKGPYRKFLHDRGLLQDFYDDYSQRVANGWVKNASHDSVLPTEAFHDVYIGQKAVEWVENISDEFPWHLFVSFVGPHTPLDPPTEYAERYRERDMPPAIRDNMEGKPEWVKRKTIEMSDEEITHTQRQFCAAVTVIDDQIGEILAALERRGMRDDTVIIFSSDHGEMLGDHGRYDKTLPYEGALRIPLIVSGPGLPENQVSDALVELNDLNPTICEMAGLPEQPDIDARSIMPVLTGETDIHREAAVAGLREFRLIRTHTHKLIDNHSGETELYDLVADPHELNNIAEDQPELVGDLRKQLVERYLEGQWRR